MTLKVRYCLMKTEIGRDWYQSIHYDNCIASKCPFPAPNGHHRERNLPAREFHHNDRLIIVSTNLLFSLDSTFKLRLPYGLFAALICYLRRNGQSKWFNALKSANNPASLKKKKKKKGNKFFFLQLPLERCSLLHRQEELGARSERTGRSCRLSRPSSQISGTKKVTSQDHPCV